MGKKRMQSPSSINIYFQCPRKYYYQYKLKMKTKPSIHLVRGSAAHYALETLYKVVPEVLSENYRHDLHIVGKELLKKSWKDLKSDFDKLDMLPEQIEVFYNDTLLMIANQINFIVDKIEERMQKKGESFVDAFKAMIPLVEEEYLSWDYYVKGFIDVIEQHDGKIRLMDYKTSKKNKLTDQYKLQLAIYALLYKDKHNKLPDEVGLYFVKFPEPELAIPVTEELIQHAKFHIEQIHASTLSDDIADYKKNKTPLCKWRTGQCDFYEYCFENKEIPPLPEPKK
ncbi:MAG: RecB family exonuclease [Candidatus Nanoarchaeia archaeon]